MKKKRMWHLIDYQRDMIEKYKKMIDQNDRTMKIQDNAIIRKDQEIEIANNAAKAIREALEETQEALDRSRNFVRIIQSDKRRSIKDMAKDLYELYYGLIDIPELIEHWKLIFKPITINNMHYFHSAVCMKVTDKNWKESVKEIIPYKVRLARSEQSLRDTLVRELPPEIDSDDVDIHIAYVFE